MREVPVARKVSIIEEGEGHQYQSCFDEEITGTNAITQKNSWVRVPVKMFS
jgi:hypothetical protein